MQHHWLVFMCGRLGLSKYILPHDVEKFVMVGYIPVTNEDASINQALCELAAGAEEHEKVMMRILVKVDPTERAEVGGGSCQGHEEPEERQGQSAGGQRCCMQHPVRG